MLTQAEIEKTHDFYDIHLKTALLPFWLKYSVDNEYGGYFTCFDNSGGKLLSTDKYTWSQGRMVWVFSKLSDMKVFSSDERSRFRQLAENGADFLMKHCLLHNGNCTFVMDRYGTPRLQANEKEYDISISADCFVVMGLARYAATVVDRKAFVFAERLYRSIIQRKQAGNYRTEPYPAPAGYRMHGETSMLMLSTAQEMAFAMQRLGDTGYAEVDKQADKYMNMTMDLFLDHKNVLHEMISEDYRFVEGTLMGRYVNPGHTIEDMWFIIHQAVEKGNKEIVYRAADVIKKTFEIGWDQDYGGLFLFADQEGGKPKGSIHDYINDRMVQKVLNDWSSKLWWPHSEALYTTLLVYMLTNDADILSLYTKVFDYTFKTFPNPDKETGEWIQIRDRAGNPEQKVVALPVKDPFHIIRNIILLIELLEKYKVG